MAKDLPWYKSEVAEHLTGNIQCCHEAARGLFDNIKAIYWQRECDLSKDQLYNMFPGKSAILDNEVPVQVDKSFLIDQLLQEGIIKISGTKVRIDFLLRQYRIKIKKSKTNSRSGKKGAAERERRKKLKKMSSEIGLLDQCKSDQDWKNVMCIKHKVKNHNVLDIWLDKFDVHAKEEKHRSLGKYKGHFSNWMNKQLTSNKIHNAIV